MDKEHGAGYPHRSVHSNNCASIVLRQVAALVTVAQAEGRTVKAGAAAAEADEIDEWTSDQLSTAAAVASSVLAHHGAASQVRARSQGLGG